MTRTYVVECYWPAIDRQAVELSARGERPPRPSSCRAAAAASSTWARSLSPGVGARPGGLAAGSPLRVDLVGLVISAHALPKARLLI
jgi:hypothetical protein